MIECFKHGLIWRGIVHDLSKLSPNEWLPYANFFYGDHGKRFIGGWFWEFKKNVHIQEAFDFAWLLHQKRNKHHWQWWILPQDNGMDMLLPMQEPYLTEMICDWVGAGKAQGHVSPKSDPMKETREWYQANKTKMSIHSDTMQEIEKRLTNNS